MQEEELYDLAKVINSKLPNGYGFCLLTFPFNSGMDNRMHYVSNGNREGIAKAMKEWIKTVDEDSFGKDL